MDATTLPLGTIDPTLYLSNRTHALTWLSAQSLIAPLEITVYWGDQDANSHVSNVRYFNWLENGRIGVLNHFHPAGGGGKSDGKGVGFILGKVGNTYVKPVFAPDHLLLGHMVAKVEEKKFEVKTLIWSFRYALLLHSSPPGLWTDGMMVE